jgi:hypothetical protein
LRPDGSPGIGEGEGVECAVVVVVDGWKAVHYLYIVIRVVVICIGINNDVSICNRQTISHAYLISSSLALVRTLECNESGQRAVAVDALERLPEFLEDESFPRGPR